MRHEERQSRFGSLILIHPLRVEPVVAASARGVIERDAKIVVPKKPVESCPCILAPPLVSGNTISIKTCRNRAPGFHRLLIEAGF